MTWRATYGEVGPGRSCPPCHPTHYLHPRSLNETASYDVASGATSGGPYLEDDGHAVVARQRGPAALRLAHAAQRRVHVRPLRRPHPGVKARVHITKCVKPLRHLATSSTMSSKWSVLIGRGDDLAPSLTNYLSGFTHFVILKAVASCVSCKRWSQALCTWVSTGGTPPRRGARVWWGRRRRGADRRGRTPRRGATLGRSPGPFTSSLSDQL